jgi:dienelactone hydrolase
MRCIVAALTLRGRRCGRGLLGGLLLVALWCGLAPAQEPCTDEPGFSGLVCRAAELRAATEDLGADPPAVAPGGQSATIDDLEAAVLELRGRADGIHVRATEAAAACDRGATKRALATLDQMETRLPRLTQALDRVRENAAPHASAAAEIQGLVALTGALTRATAARVRRHPCPELVEILRPADGERSADHRLFLLMRMAAAADPQTLEVILDGGRRVVPVAPAEASATQAWGTVECPSAGRWVVRVTVRDRMRTVVDEERAVVRCGAAGRLALGPVVETLVTHDHAANVLRLTPVRPLRSGVTYAVVATRGLRTEAGRRTRPDAAFRAAAGAMARPNGPGRAGSGPRAVFVADALNARNPYPSERLVQADGTIRIPDGFTARALTQEPRLDGVREFLRRLDGLVAEHPGFSPHAAAVLHFDDAIALRSARPEHAFIAEVVNPGPPDTNLPALLDALERDAGIPPARVTVASVFTIEDVAGDMTTIRSQVARCAAQAPPQLDLSDPEPSDSRLFGTFHAGDAAFADFFPDGAPASVGTVVRGRFASPEYRRPDEQGRRQIDAAFLDGSETPPTERIEFLLVLPAGAPPRDGFPVVIAQHGFCGDHGFVLDIGKELTAAGLAVVGIPAPEHGGRGDCIGFFDFVDFNAFGANWQQASIDLFQLVQLVTAGIDLDHDGARELATGHLGYLGVSMGGVIGAVFAAIEPEITAAVLTVPGGRLAQFAGSVSSLAAPFLARFAEEAGIAARTCGGAVGAVACARGGDCPAGAACVFGADFVAMLDAALPSFQALLDPGDGSAYAHLLRLAPAGGRPKAVLVQEGVGDLVVANPLSEALARAIALPVNQPDHAALGVAGLWRFPPPAGHGILALAEVRAQAVRFLASGGTEIVAP